jgi:hypothetical protein
VTEHKQKIDARDRRNYSIRFFLILDVKCNFRNRHPVGSRESVAVDEYGLLPGSDVVPAPIDTQAEQFSDTLSAVEALGPHLF